ncbi:DUF6541 family protein [Qaidamihabitans albus]|uniref:DUF6541 family protein n=1 Tax=Qaidamihabitans albus TaxID=2795733 RepID=UPI0018F235A0|nr:DUF6541 family protein [Qaidamihabitans albus]
MNAVLVLAAFWLPGLAIGAAIRLRGWTLAAAAPALTFGAVAVGVAVLGRLGIAWNLPNALLWTLALAVVLALLSWMRVRRWPARTESEEDPAAPRRPPREQLLIGGGVAAGMLVGTVTFLRGIGGLNRINQDWDAPFHGNLVRWIAEHESALSSTFAEVGARPDAENFFYPGTYHALLALVLDRAGLTMPELLNLAALAVVLALPLGVAALAAAWRMPTLAVASAAAVCTWFSAFPYDSLWRGPLWPYVAGVAMIPAVLAMARHLVRPRGIAGVAGVPIGLAGLVGLHTSIAVVAAVYALFLLAALALRFEPVDWRLSWPYLAGAAVLGALLVVPLVLPALGTAGEVADFVWPSKESVAGGFGQMITFTPNWPLPQWWLGLPAIAGIFLLVRHRRMLWMVGAYVALGGLYAATVSMESPLIHALTSPFYNDHWRLGALLPLAGAIAFGEFVATAGGGLGDWARRRWPGWSPAAAATTGVVVVGLVLGLLGNGAYIGRNAGELATRYTDGPTVTTGEREAFAWLASRVGPDEHVMNGRTDGTNWMYALAGVKPVEWAYAGPLRGSPAQVLTARLDELGNGGPDARVREALNELNVRYVILGEGFVRKFSVRGRGLRQLADNPSFREVYRNPDAVIYRIESRRIAPAAAIGPG